MLTLNASFENRHISQFRGLIDVLNYWNWGDKDMVELREEILVGLIQFKLEHHLIFGS
jgi:hypothetical protein